MTFNQRIKSLRNKTTDAMNEMSDLQQRCEIAQAALEKIARMVAVDGAIDDEAVSLAKIALGAMNK